MKFSLIISFVLISYYGIGQVADSAAVKAEAKLQSTKHKIDSMKTDLQTYPASLHAQVDSIKIPGDSATHVALHKVDSIRTGFENSIDSLQTAYKNTFSKIDNEEQALRHKIDSLTTFKLPTDKLTRKLDSLQSLRPQKLTEFTQKTEQLKTKATSELKQVNMPPQLQEPWQKLTQSVQGYSLPGIDKIAIGDKLPDLDLPSFKLPAIGELDLPEVKNMDIGKLDNLKMPSGVKLPDFNGMKPQMAGLKDMTGKVGEYGKDVQNVTTQLQQVKDIDKAVDTQVMKIDEVQDLQKNAGEFANMSGSMDEEAMKNRLKEAALKEAMPDIKSMATDHFAGKEEVLKKAMAQVSKLKSKYSEVKSLSELPKRVPNPMKEKPLIERIVPGVTFLIQKKDLLLLDVNPVIRFKFTGRFTAGLGWNQRLAFDGWNIKDRSLIYGPRGVAEFKWGKGFHFLFSPELMNTSIPPQLRQPTTESTRAWVPGMFGGLKKEFTVYKQIKGNTEMLYNLINTHGRSPYADRFVIRFGFEFPMKKKPKKVTE